MKRVSLSTGLRLAGFFAIATTMILLTLNFVVKNQVNHQFQNTVKVYQLEQRLENGERVPVAEIVRTERKPRPEGGPGEFFKREFGGILFWVTLVGIIVSMALGYLLAYFFVSKPLLKLRLAVEKLKRREKPQELEQTGVREFDQLMEDFNGLATELSRVEVLRQNLISDTSHELKTPLSALKVQLEGIKDGVLKMDNARASLLLDQVDRLANLTDTLQEYARLRSKASNIQKKPVNVEALISGVIAEQENAIKEANIMVTLTIPADLTVMADKNLLTQLVSNLIANAVRHADATEIMITATSDSLVVSDNGKGVPKQALTDIFERFFRVEQSRNRKEAGMGLGLAIVREIAHAHGWKITAKNASPGLVFIIEINSPSQA